MHVPYARLHTAIAVLQRYSWLKAGIVRSLCTLLVVQQLSALLLCSVLQPARWQVCLVSRCWRRQGGYRAGIGSFFVLFVSTGSFADGEEKGETP